MKEKNKSRKLFRNLLVLGLGIQMILTSGCALLLVGAAAGAAVAGTAWYMGSLTGTEKATPKQVETATIEAFKQLNIKKTMVQSGTMKSVIEGENPEGRGVSVTAQLEQDGSTKISIRVGTFGDKDASTTLYGKIRENLGAVGGTQNQNQDTNKK